MRDPAPLSAVRRWAWPGCLALLFSIGSAGCGEKSTPAHSTSAQSVGQPLAPASCRLGRRTFRSRMVGSGTRSQAVAPERR